MREKFFPESDFKGFIQQASNSNKRRTAKLKEGLIAPNRIEIVKSEMSKKHLSLVIAKYSAGYEPSSLIGHLDDAVDILKDTSSRSWLLSHDDKTALNQYTLTSYDHILWLLSLSVLLDRPRIQFEKLADRIDEDGVIDAIFECCLTYKLKNRKPVSFLSNGHPEGSSFRFKMYKGLREAVVATDKKVSSDLINVFLETEWLQEHRQSGHFKSHKSKHNIYPGYWSFGAAAVVKTLELDDTQFRDFIHYQADLINIPPFALQATSSNKEKNTDTQKESPFHLDWEKGDVQMEWKEITDILNDLRVTSGQTSGKVKLFKLLEKMREGRVIVPTPDRDWILSSKDDLQRLVDTYDSTIIIKNYRKSPLSENKKASLFERFWPRK